MHRRIDAATLKSWLHDGAEIALIDVREAGEFGEGHLFFAVPLPYSRLELDIARLVPRLATRIVLCDGGVSNVAARAAQRLAALGYTSLHVLDGGTAAWAASGRALFKGVNVPSKCFGELVEHAYETPRITASELAKRTAAGERLVIIDGRPVAEFQKMSIPGALCCPNGELILRFDAIVPDPSTTVVINCAGRTRSIIGAQSLRDCGVPNPVFALENGTQGWMLADLELDHGSRRRYPDHVDDPIASTARSRAAEVARRFAVPTVSAAEVSRWLGDSSRTTFLCDVRTAEEFAEGSVAGAVHAPGGQLVQATDQWIGVRNARIVLIDAEGARAVVIASWLRRMGHEAYVLQDGVRSGLRGSVRAADAPAAVRPIGAEELREGLMAGRMTLFDLRPSMSYRRLHPAGARWSIRSRIVADAEGTAGTVVLLPDEPSLARLAAIDLREAGREDVRIVAGGMAAWEAAGLATESTPQLPADDDCIDYLFFVHDRHEGNLAAARAYLAWETNLLAQIDAAELATFKVKP